jgi:diguanylate cyclase (GGDEF)-like protein
MMRPLPLNSRWLLWLLACLAGSYVAIAGFSYLAATDSLRKVLAREIVPTVADLAHAEVGAVLQRSLTVTAMLAHDPLVRGWLAGGQEAGAAAYLGEMDRRHGIGELSLASEKSRQRYRSNGERRALRPGQAADAWFFRMRDARLRYALGADAEGTGDGGRPAINQRVDDERGRFLGAVGTALPVATLAQRLAAIQARTRCRIHLVDASGIIVLGDLSMQHLRDQPGLREIAGDILYATADAAQVDYPLRDSTVTVNSRLIPELGWVLVVTADDRAEVARFWQAALLSLLVGAAATGIVFLFVRRRLGIYHVRLLNAAGLDPVTGLMNRSAYEFVLQQTLLETDRAGEPLALIVFEIDAFAVLSRAVGRNGTERLLHQAAALSAKAVRDSDPVVRWADCRFLIQLRNCPLVTAGIIAERLRLKLAAHDFGEQAGHRRLTASFGVSLHEAKEAGGAFVERTAALLALARAEGGNRVATHG